jgi:multiple sugar transport system ATP-binding protein
MVGVSLRGVSKLFRGSVQALDQLTLEVRDREFLVLVGPSGCGKTTTLRLIAGLEKPTAGEVYIGDRCVNEVPPKDRGIAMVFQNYALYPHLTAAQNIAFGLSLQRLSKAVIQRRVDEAAEILDLKEVLKRKPRELSGGQKQRVALGRALVRQPKVVLFDEPLSNLDGKLRAQLRAELRRLHERIQATMIYVTHDTTEAMTMGDRIAVMRAGRIEQTDEPLTIYQQPANLFVAGFLGQPPMNFLNGELRRTANGGWIFHEANGGSITGELPSLPALSEIGARKITLGLRPEAVRLLAADAKSAVGGAVFQAVIDLVEPLGSETQVHLQTGGHRLIARTQLPLSHAEQGHRARCEIDFSQARIFDPESGQAF